MLTVSLDCCSCISVMTLTEGKLITLFFVAHDFDIQDVDQYLTNSKATHFLYSSSRTSVCCFDEPLDYRLILLSEDNKRKARMTHDTFSCVPCNKSRWSIIWVLYIERRICAFPFTAVLRLSLSFQCCYKRKRVNYFLYATLT